MSSILDTVGFVCVLTGAAFCMIGGYGLLRMPDFYTRTHAVGVTDTFGAGFILVGLMFHAPDFHVAIKLLMTLTFMLVTGPVASHALAKAAFAHGVVVHDSDEEDSDEVRSLGNTNDVPGGNP